MADLAQPDRVYWVNGSQAEYDRICGEMVDSGIFLRLNPRTLAGVFLCAL
jgi:phosphoenolpyruvate carboxykinase (GTP)